MNRVTLLLLSLLIAGLVIGGTLWYRQAHRVAVAPPDPHTMPAALATAPQTTPSAPAKPPTTQLLDVIRAEHPRYPVTRPMEEAVDLRYAARIVLNDPVYLDQAGHLWITRADAPEEIDFKSRPASMTHVVRDRVVFVLWSPDATNTWVPHLVVRNPAGSYDLLNHTGRRPLDDPLGFRWDRAIVLYGPRGVRDRVVVPTRTGACAFGFHQSPAEILGSHHALIDAGAGNTTRPTAGAPATPPESQAVDRAIQLTLDLRGVIAWVTDGSGRRGERGVARFAPVDAPPSDRVTEPEYRWTTLTGTPGWPDRLLHLVPLLDGSILQILSDDEPGKVVFGLNTIETTKLDMRPILRLVDQLSASDQDRRDEAFKKLMAYGPNIAPMLEKMVDDQPPEAAARIRQLLRNKVTPSLGGMTVMDSKLRLVSRFADGGVLFYAETGVSIPRPDEDPLMITPAWVTVRPGRPVELLPEALGKEITPQRHTVTVSGNNFVVTDPAQGPQWFLGNQLRPLLRKSERRFSRFAGIDGMGRWVFREVPTGTAMAEEWAAASDRNKAGGATLVLDPRLPDVTPRLPGWLLPPSAGKVGWDASGWPVIYMDAQPGAVPWALEKTHWRAMDESKETVHTDPGVMAVPGTTRSTTAPSQPAAAESRPAASQAAGTAQPATTRWFSTRPADSAPAEWGRALYTGPDGSRYFGGRDELIVLRADGTHVQWRLPDKVAGELAPWLAVRPDGAIFLYNAPGRIVRIVPAPKGAEPFEVEGIFTRGIPNDPQPLRIWLDPSQRLCIAHDQNRITVLFTDGRIPPAIVEKMPYEREEEE